MSKQHSKKISKIHTRKTSVVKYEYEKSKSLSWENGEKLQRGKLTTAACSTDG